MKTSIVRLIAALVLIILICFPLGYLSHYFITGLKCSNFATLIFRVSPEAFRLMILTTIFALMVLWWILLMYIINTTMALKNRPKATTVLSIDDPDIERKLAFIYNREQRVNHR